MGALTIPFFGLLLFMNEVSIIAMSPIGLVFGYILGAPQAVLTGVIIQLRYRNAAVVSVFGIVLCSFVGWVFGGVMNYFVIIRLIAKDRWEVTETGLLAVLLPLFAGLVSTIILWALRPRQWVGPNNKMVEVEKVGK